MFTQVENKRDAMSPVLQNLCISPSQPITVIRGLAAALKLGVSVLSMSFKAVLINFV